MRSSPFKITAKWAHFGLSLVRITRAIIYLQVGEAWTALELIGLPALMQQTEGHPKIAGRVD